MLSSVGKLVEIGYVVVDLDEAMAFTSSTMGAGPFSVFEHLNLRNARYRGAPTAVDVDIAMGAAGGVVIELICPRSAAPSPFHMPTGGARMALNHWSVFSDDLDRDLQLYEGRGFQPVFSAEVPDGESDSVARLAYLDTFKSAGAYFELMESTPGVLVDLYRRILSAPR
jgi:hypothetical protein